MESIIYFSPTGNAKHLAELLAIQLGKAITSIYPLELLDQNPVKKSDHLILMYPIHGFNAPRNVRRFVNDLEPNQYMHISLLAVGCADHWANSAVSFDLRRPLIRKGYEIIVDEVLAMPLTFIMAFDDELSSKIISESEERIGKIAKAISGKQKTIKRTRKRAHVLNFIGKIEHPAARLFGLELRANNNCTSCGTCWENCPSGNIRINKKEKPKFGFKCLMCMRCIYNCPEKAISPRFSKFIPIKKGYSLKKYRPLF